MYNKKQKYEFMRTQALSELYFSRYVALFNCIGDLERKWHTDVCAMAPERLQDVVTAISGVRDITNARWAMLRTYIKWCVSQNVAGAVDNTKLVKLNTVPKKKVRTVANPLQLQVYLDTICDPEDMHSADNTLRAYLWLAFAGVPMHKVCELTTGDVDLNSLTVRCGGYDLPIYREGLAAIKNCVELMRFTMIREGKPCRYERVKSDKLLRGTKSDPKFDNIGTFLRRAHLKAAQTKTITKEIAYSGAMLSGRCYRLYEREQAGLPLDFDGVAHRIIELEEFEGNFDAKYARTKQMLKKDYEAWKTTF